MKGRWGAACWRRSRGVGEDAGEGDATCLAGTRQPCGRGGATRLAGMRLRGATRLAAPRERPARRRNHTDAKGRGNARGIGAKARVRSRASAAAVGDGGSATARTGPSCTRARSSFLLKIVWRAAPRALEGTPFKSGLRLYWCPSIERNTAHGHSVRRRPRRQRRLHLGAEERLPSPRRELSRQDGAVRGSSPHRRSTSEAAHGVVRGGGHERQDHGDEPAGRHP